MEAKKVTASEKIDWITKRLSEALMAFGGFLLLVGVVLFMVTPLIPDEWAAWILGATTIAVGAGIRSFSTGKFLRGA